MSKLINFNTIEEGVKISHSETSYLSKGYGIISQYVTKNKNISLQAKGVFAYLSSCAGNDKQTYPNQTTMCNDLGIKKLDTLRKYLNELAKEGFIKIIKTKKGNVKYKNVYYVADNTITSDVWKKEFEEGREFEEMEIEENKKDATAPTEASTQENKIDNPIIHKEEDKYTTQIMENENKRELIINNQRNKAIELIKKESDDFDLLPPIVREAKIRKKINEMIGEE